MNESQVNYAELKKMDSIGCIPDFLILEKRSERTHGQS